MELKIRSLRYLLHLSIIVFVLSGCDSRNQNYIQFEIPEKLNKSNVKRFKVSDIYSNIDGFELDRSAGPIGRVSKVLIYNDILYVLDRRYAKKIFAFDLLNEGKFLFRIGTIGKGAGEFLMIADFTIDKLTKSLIVVDVRQRKLSYFKLDGTYYDEKKLNFSPIKLFCDSNFYYFVKYPDDISNNGMIVTDKKMELVKSFFPSNEYPTTPNVDSRFIEINNRTFFNYTYCDSIYEIKDGNLRSYLALSSNGKSIYEYLKSIELKSETISDIFFNSSIIPEEENVFIPQDYFEDNKIQMFTFIKKRSHRFIVDIKNDSLSPSLGYISEDIIGGAFNPIGYDEKYGTLSVLSFNQLKRVKYDLLEINKNRISNKLIEDLAKFNPDSNPFILFYK